MVTLSVGSASCGGGDTAEPDGLPTGTEMTSEPVSATTVAAAIGAAPTAASVPTSSSAVTLATVTSSTAAPASSWRMMAASPLSPRSFPVSAWTGNELVVWSGVPSTSDECGMDEGGGSLCGDPAVFDGAAYSPATDTWRTIADGPVPAGGAPTQVIPQGVWTGTELVVWGGWGLPIAAAYDPVSDSWRDLPPGPLADREQHAVVAWDGRVAVLGGRQPLGPGELQPRLDGAVLDPRTGEWSSLPELPAGDPMMAPGLVSATVANGRLFVVARVTADAYVLDPDGTQWRNLGAADVDGFLNPVGVAAGRWLFATSGGPDRPTTVAAVLDLTSGQWTRTADPPIVTSGYLSAGAGDRVLAMAGRWTNDTSAPAAVSWDPATDSWTELPPPPLAHRVGAAVAWTGNELLVWGGASTGGVGGPSHVDGAAYHP